MKNSSLWSNQEKETPDIFLSIIYRRKKYPFDWNWCLLSISILKKDLRGRFDRKIVKISETFSTDTHFWRHICIYEKCLL